MLAALRLAAILGIALIILVGVMGFIYISASRNEARHDDRVSICRGNVARGYLLLRAREFTVADTPIRDSTTTKIAPELFQILDCDSGLPLSTPEQERYLQVLNTGVVPEIVNGLVTVPAE
jgi:hypothetical protein